MKIFIVSYSICGLYPQLQNHFFDDQGEAVETYVTLRDGIGDDPSVIQLIELDGSTGTILDSFEGTSDDLVEEEYDGAWVL